MADEIDRMVELSEVAEGLLSAIDDDIDTAAALLRANIMDIAKLLQLMEPYAHETIAALRTAANHLGDLPDVIGEVKALAK